MMGLNLKILESVIMTRRQGTCSDLKAFLGKRSLATLCLGVSMGLLGPDLGSQVAETFLSEIPSHASGADSQSRLLLEVCCYSGSCLALLLLCCCHSQHRFWIQTFDPNC